MVEFIEALPDLIKGVPCHLVKLVVPDWLHFVNFPRSYDASDPDHGGRVLTDFVVLGAQVR